MLLKKGLHDSISNQTPPPLQTRSTKRFLLCLALAISQISACTSDPYSVPSTSQRHPLVYGKTAQERVNQWQTILKLHQIEEQNGLPRGLLGAVMHQESAGKVYAQSPVGALGLFQFMPETANDYKLYDRTNPYQSARAAGQYLNFLSRKYNGNLELTLAAYNWGLGRVDRYLSNNYYYLYSINRMPSETRNYVTSVLSKIQLYQ